MKPAHAIVLVVVLLVLVAGGFALRSMDGASDGEKRQRGADAAERQGKKARRKARETGGADDDDDDGPDFNDPDRIGRGGSPDGSGKGGFGGYLWRTVKAVADGIFNAGGK